MPTLKTPAPLPAGPPSAYDAFYLRGPTGRTPANAVRLALADHQAKGHGVPEFERELRRAAAILDVVEKYAYPIQRALDTAIESTESDLLVDARRALINALV